MDHSHLIRVEGVNHAAVLDDTDDISTRRGGSAMLRDAPRALTQRFPELVVVSLEASIGLFRATTDQPDALVARITTDLAARYPFVTFVVDAAPLPGEPGAFGKALREVTAKNRFRQLRQPTLAIPTTAAAPDAQTPVCEKDRLRPAVTTLPADDEALAVSASVKARRDLGRDERKRLLPNLLGQSYRVSTTRDLASLAADNGRDFGNLGGKMAVLYADGNGFGKIKQQFQDDHTLAQAFDKRVQRLNRAYLRDLVDSAQADPYFLQDGDLRLEVLLVGGDELMLVTPAWRGMETLQRFFEAVAEEHAEALAENPAAIPAEVLAHELTYAAGLVFCAANTPIAEIVRTVKGLAEEVKESDRTANRFDYLVLESVDYPTQSVADFRREHFGRGASAALRPLAPLSAEARMAGVEHLPWHARLGETAAFLDDCPRGAIRDLARRWLDLRNADEDEPKRAAEQRFLARHARFTQRNQALSEPLHHRLFRSFVPGTEAGANPAHAGWVHLTELWDYLAPQPASADGSGS